MQIINQLKKYKKAFQPTLGFSVGKIQNEEGVVVTAVHKNSLGQKVGIRKNDIITHFNNRKVNSLRDIVVPYGFNQEFMIQVVREGHKKPIGFKIKCNSEKIH